MGFAYRIYNWGVSLGKISIQKERQRPYYGLERVETTRRGQGQTMNDKEKLEEAIRQIDELLENISETKERWIDTSVNHEAFNTPKQFSILMEKAIFLGIVIRDLGNMKRTLKKDNE